MRRNKMTRVILYVNTMYILSIQPITMYILSIQPISTQREYESMSFSSYLLRITHELLLAVRYLPL